MDNQCEAPSLNSGINKAHLSRHSIPEAKKAEQKCDDKLSEINNQRNEERFRKAFAIVDGIEE